MSRTRISAQGELAVPRPAQVRGVLLGGRVVNALACASPARQQRHQATATPPRPAFINRRFGNTITSASGLAVRFLELYLRRSGFNSHALLQPLG